MQRNKPDPKSYQNGQIYAIRSYQTDMIYIGSTCTLLSKRLYHHKIEYMLQRKYYSSFEILKYDDAYIELLEDYPCKSKKELERREGQLIRENRELCVNCQMVGRTKKQWREDNSATIKQKKKVYYQKNTEKIKQCRQEYYQKNTEKIKQCIQKYYKKNKKRLRERQPSNHLCECGKYYTLYQKARHMKSNHHKQELDIFDYTDMILEVENMTKQFDDYFKCKNCI